MKYRLAEDTKEDALHFVELYNSIYNRKVNFEYYRWQFFEPPHPAYLFFAMEQSVTVGCIGVHVKRVLPNNSTVLMLIDMMVEPCYREKGVFRVLHDKVLAHGQSFGPRAAAVMANRAGMLALTGRQKWLTVDIIPTFTLTTTGVPESLDVAPFCAISTTNRISNILSFQRSKAYQTWRYGNHPFYKYEVTQIKEDYAVTKLFKDTSNGFVYGDIVDSKVTSESEANLLLSLVISKLESRGAREIHTWLHSGELWNTACQRRGFALSSLCRYFCIQIFDSSFSMACDETNWSLHLSDSEIF